MLRSLPKTVFQAARRRCASPLSALGATLGVLALLLQAGVAGAAAAQDGSRHPGFVGTATCAGCHAQEHAAWQGSHHDLAMQKPTPDTVLGDFDNARFDYFGTETRFLRRDGQYIVRTDGPDGELRDFPVAWVFGVYPLQQYLLPLDDGRLQALSIAWDSRAAAEGGQRWYHLYPDEQIAHDDPLHWTGPYQNWNTRCAECHSTDLHKNYDGAARRFSTVFFEEDVGCEACHGPGERHSLLAREQRLEGAAAGGFDTDLGARGEWYFPEGAAIARRRSPPEDQRQIDGCGRCHARRGTLGEYRYGQALSDTHRLSLLGRPLYHHDGQILDEDYVYGSFVQSKMHLAGVVCSNCHEPHSNRLRAEGNGVCTQCHRASVYDGPDHHHHRADPAGSGGNIAQPASAGSQCVNCHMPAQTYMGVDARRDHSMRIPRPDISVMTGTPNACTQCHADRDADWALESLRSWGVNFTDSGDHPAVAMAALQRGDVRGVPRLAQLARDESAATIWRATALERAAGAGDRDALQLASTFVSSPEPLLRISAVRALQQLPPTQRYSVLRPLLGDPVRGVRMELAQALAATPLGDLDAQARGELLELFDEYRALQREHADMPSVQLQLGLFHLSRGDFPAAELAYREALDLNPQLLGARLNLADLLRGAGREAEAREELLQALSYAPENGDAMHALGLLEARAGNRKAALDWLGRAAAVEEQGSRHRFVFAVAQHDFGDRGGAISTLRRLHRAFPADEQTLLALANYSAGEGDMLRAKDYARKLVELAPGNRSYRQLVASLGG